MFCTKIQFNADASLPVPVFYWANISRTELDNIVLSSRNILNLSNKTLTSGFKAYRELVPDSNEKKDNALIGDYSDYTVFSELDIENERIILKLKKTDKETPQYNSLSDYLSSDKFIRF